MTQNPSELRGEAHVNGTGTGTGTDTDTDTGAGSGAARVTDGARPLAEVCDELRRKVAGLLDEDVDDEILKGVQGQVRVSIGVIKEALQRYGLEHLALSYNGGKDCLVLLILILASLPACPEPAEPNGKVAASSGRAQRLKSVYIVSEHPFAEVERFVGTSSVQYHLNLARYELPMRAALEAYLAEETSVQAVFVGTRRTDPHGTDLTHFDPTDSGWPQFMRIHPVIDWHYAEIWAFIRHLGIPFCDLYNRGFTSLGGTTDTHPNPALALGGNKNKFRPAYELMADDEERLGRDR